MSTTKGHWSKDKPLYLDYQATTPTDPRVVEKMLPFFSERFGNPHSRTHH
ncbi:MAG: aminotransferase class V-fold PLP-dependent enzyme, partial [Rhodospirillales bacterium]|nr:aminotransferase class V-fold PLP-dependent enzyme [Rhodospirillales bacterium]